MDAFVKLYTDAPDGITHISGVIPIHVDAFSITYILFIGNIKHLYQDF